LRKYFHHYSTLFINIIFLSTNIYIHGKNDFAEGSKILLDIDPRIILLKL